MVRTYWDKVEVPQVKQLILSREFPLMTKIDVNMVTFEVTMEREGNQLSLEELSMHCVFYKQKYIVQY